MNEIRKLAQKYEKEMIENRRKFHKYPELGGAEEQTSKYVAKQLEEMGVEVKRGFAKTGIQGMIYGYNPEGKTIMIRADMDALPMEEMSGCEYSSQIKGVMHSCGHDVHTAVLLGTARILTQMKDKLNGNIKFCFQPAEETIGGADLMVSDGIMENPHVDYVVGMHVDPTNKVGTVSLEKGPITSYPDFFEVRFKGRGGHGAFPSKSIDPILPAVEAYSMIQSISKRVSPLEPCVIQICFINAGNDRAIIPDTAVIGGTVRTLHSHNREIVKSQIEEISKHISAIYGVEYEMDYRGKCFPVYNTPEITDNVKKYIGDIFEGGFVSNESMKIGGEDFCFYCEKAQSTFMVIGSANDDISTQYALHNPKFNVDESVLALGAEAFAKIAMEYLNGEI